MQKGVPAREMHSDNPRDIACKKGSVNHPGVETTVPGKGGINVKRAYVSGNFGVAIDIFGGYGDKK